MLEVFLSEQLPKEAINEEQVHIQQEFYFVQPGVLEFQGKEITSQLLLARRVGSKSFVILKCFLIRS